MVETNFKQTDLGKIPKDWDIAVLQDNITLKARIGWQGLTTAEYRESGDYYLITGTDFKNGYIDWKNCVFVDKIRYDQDRNIQVKEKDILVTKDGTIGKVAYIDSISKPTTLNSGVFVLRILNEKLDSRFIYYILMSFYFDNFLKQITAGSTITHLYQKDFIHFNFIVPPLPEQKAIAEVLSDTDHWITSLEDLIAKKQLIKQGAMQKLLTPKDDWEVKKIREIAKVGRGRVISHKEINSSQLKKYPVYSSQTTNNGVMGFIDTYDFDGEYVTWTTDGEKAGTVFHRIGRFNCTNVCGTIKLVNDNPKFICYILGTVASKHVSRNLANPKLMNEPMKNIELAIPSLLEQERIANILSDMDAEIETLEQKLAKAKQVKQGLMQKLLTGKIRLV
ncbi:restriction endonuclease subunit S [Empedobacter brevis]|uniref:restriction endonuclease subunit S n=1 Tax=Empedobacter brevis TaxID=247 RepID=UPI00123CF28D|nr:restriction endonuclease subunit S [Empedobacter brevis]QES91831.1 restriction endonuclease subunit S [Empedobacter brevis]